MDINYGKGLMLEYEEQEEDFLQIGTSEFGYLGDLKLENHVEYTSNFVSGTNSFAPVPSFPKPIVVPPPPPYVLNPSTAQFLFRKELKSSDVGQAHRIIIPKAHATNYFPHLTDGDGIFIYMDDMDAPRVWVFRFRYWLNNNSRMYVLEKTGDFVKECGLGVGDVIMFYKDEHTQRYGIQARKNLNKEWTPMDDENVLLSYFGNYVPSTNEMGTYTYTYPVNNMQNYTMNFLGGPELTVPDDEQSTSFNPANVNPYYYF